MVLRRLFGGRGANAFEQEPVAGGLYSVIKSRKTADFGVAKVLVLDDLAVHVRSYANSYSVRPDTIDTSTLTLGGGTPLVRHADGSITLPRPQGPMGIGHLPISRDQFLAWRPQLISIQQVSKEELDGYREWREASGGVWG